MFRAPTSKARGPRILLAPATPRVPRQEPRLLPAAPSVGGGSDGLLQFEVKAGAAGVQAAVARLAHSAGFKELLAGNGHLLVTAAGAEDVAAIPCIRNRGEMERLETVWQSYLKI